MENVIYRLLQSGFIAPDSSALITIPEHDETLVKALSGQSMFRLDTSNFYDQEVTQIYSNFVSDMRAFSKFDFRELVLKKAFACFYGESFVTWVRAQTKSPAISYLHRRYLRETLLFALNGTPRKMSNSNYFRLLHVGANTEVFKNTESKDDYISLNEILDKARTGSSYELIRNWTERLDGMIDLLETLNVIYGRHGPSPTN